MSIPGAGAERAQAEPWTPVALKAAIRRRADELGFELCGFCAAERSPRADAFLRWLQSGHAAGMAYFARDPERRTDPRRVLAGARTVVVVAMGCGAPPEPTSEDGGVGVFARYARGDDYHEVMSERLLALLACIRQCAPGVEGRVAVDTAPLLERDLAARAGVGWIGRNAMLIHPRLGSHLLLGEVLLTAEVEPDATLRDACGSCRRCVDACPTGAIVEGRVVDSRRCIAYHTIESREAIPPEVAERMGNRVFGCDICQEVCPFNRNEAPAREPRFAPRAAVRNALLVDLVAQSDEDFRASFRHSAVKRARRSGLARNAAACLGATRPPAAEQTLRRALQDASPLVRAQAELSLRLLRGCSLRSSDRT